MSFFCHLFSFSYSKNNVRSSREEDSTASITVALLTVHVQHTEADFVISVNNLPFIISKK